MSEPRSISFDDEDSSLRLEFVSVEAATAFAREAVASAGFLMTIDRELKQHVVVAVHVSVAEALRFQLEASVAQHFGAAQDGVRTAFLLHEWSPERSAALEAALEAAARHVESLAGEAIGTAASTESAGEEASGLGEEAEEVSAVDQGETRGVSPAHRIRSMNPSQKAILATRAGRSQRQILLRESSPQVLTGLLVKPRLEAKDVLQLVRSTHATAGLLQRVAEDQRWAKNQEILASVAKNPKTPTPLAVRLVERLRLGDLRTMAKMSAGMREVVRRAALREYLKRTSQ